MVETTGRQAVSSHDKKSLAQHYSQGGLGALMRTIRHLDAAQVTTRAAHQARRYYWRALRKKRDDTRPLAPRNLAPLWKGLDGVARTPDSLWSHDLRVADSVLSGCFEFIGEIREFDGEVEWNDPGMSQLWRYHLHYFGYTRALLVLGRKRADSRAFEVFRALVLSWNSSNRQMRGDGWHPYTLSLRCVNWLQAWIEWRKEIEADADFCRSFLGSLGAQGRALFQQLELDVRGNHLLENVRALLWLGLAFEGPEPYLWHRDALKYLERETAEQVLEDGGHFERTPGYHVVVLRDYLEIALLLERNGTGCPAWIRQTVQRQAKFLFEILGPYERIPLLKDTAWDACLPPGDLLNATAAWLQEPSLKPASPPSTETFLLLGQTLAEAAGRWPAQAQGLGSVACAASGYYLMRGMRDVALFDVGQPCPSYLPAHAHADSLSYEYHFEGIPVVVDSGVFEYKRGNWRDYFRSTRAHNTIEIGEENSSEVWASFRVGRRARVFLDGWSTGPGWAVLKAHHDGYRFLPGRPVHERVAIWRDGEYLIVLDRVSNAGLHRVTNHVHFHPDLDPREDGLRWKIIVGTTSLWLHPLGAPAVHRFRGEQAPRLQGWYSDRFGARAANTVLALVPESRTPLTTGYALSPHRDLDVVCEDRTHGIRIQVIADGRQRTCEIASKQVLWT